MKPYLLATLERAIKTAAQAMTLAVMNVMGAASAKP